MKAMTVGALIDYLQRNYKWDDTLLTYIIEEDDYAEACATSPIPWERGAHILADNTDWITPEIHNWMAQTIGEEEEK